MSKENKGKKKKVVKVVDTATKTVSTAKAKYTSAGNSAASAKEMTFGRETFKWMGIGVVLMGLGYIAMLGGHNDDPNVWDPNVIYNWRILILAPILILAGLIVQIYAIFKK